jgi:hypothetical protein
VPLADRSPLQINHRRTKRDQVLIILLMIVVDHSGKRTFGQKEIDELVV